MSETPATLRGHVILVVTPNDDDGPSYRAYLVAEDDPQKVQEMISPHLLAGEVMYVLAAFPDVLQQIPGLECGGALRL
jgi:hypothetical protein